MEFFYRNYFHSKPISSNTTPTTDFSKYQKLEIKQVYRRALFWAAIYGVFGVLVYYIPLHLFPVFFSKQLSINVFGATLELRWLEIVWCLFLTIIELMLLTFLHLHMVHRISHIAGVLTTSSKSQVINDLYALATNQTKRNIKSFGLNPFQGINKFWLLLLNLLTKMKGVIANKLVRYMLQRFTSRYFSKFLLDIAGTPIYMALNMIVTRKIYHDLMESIYGSLLIDSFLISFEDRELNDSEKHFLYDAVQLVVMCKRGFHPNHTKLTKSLFSFYTIPLKEKHLFNENFWDQLSQASIPVQDLCKKVIVLGFILDGNLSVREKKRFNHLRTNNVIVGMTPEILEDIALKFKQGKLTSIFIP